MNAVEQPRTGPILLGLFILGQLFFLASANLLGFLSSLRDDAKNSPPAEETAHALEHLAPGWLKEEGHLHDAQRILTSLVKPWEQVTGQYQNWSLFSPDISREIIFPAVEFRWDDDPVPTEFLTPLAAANPWEAIAPTLAARSRPAALAPEVFLSDNEPADPTHYFRFGQFRIRRYEGLLEVSLLPDESWEQWRDRIRDRTLQEGGKMRYYLLWRWREFERRHPGRPRPTQLILLMRSYQIRPPEEAPPFWDGPSVHPVARLRPPRTAVEAYDPEAERFEAP